METYTTVKDLKEAMLKAQEAVDGVQRLLSGIHPAALIPPESNSDSRNSDPRVCPLLPEISEIDIHPAGAHCGLTFPLLTGDVINPVRNISEMLRIMLAVLDAVPPNTQLPRR